MHPVQETFAALLKEGSTLSSHKACGLCNELIKHEPALWTFFTVKGVEPTSNAAKRAVRPDVLWRKDSFSSNSDGGCAWSSVRCPWLRPIATRLSPAHLHHWRRPSSLGWSTLSVPSPHRRTVTEKRKDDYISNKMLVLKAPVMILGPSLVRSTRSSM
ncbi:MAG TPA: hypothetical protein DEP84_19215 [Chloroflexi bacterium]|nr:hypothetical protein [Chloroflexota bacterium]